MKSGCSPCCRAGTWWHDWRGRWCGRHQILVRRWRCSSCLKTGTLLPRGFMPRFQASFLAIVRVCFRRFQGKPWVEVHGSFHRQRMRWWMRVAQTIKKAWKDLMGGLRQLAKKSQAPFSRFWLPHPRVS